MHLLQISLTKYSRDIPGIPVIFLGKSWEFIDHPSFFVNPCAGDGSFGEYKMIQQKLKTLIVLIKCLPMNTNMAVFKRFFSKFSAHLCLLQK